MHILSHRGMWDSEGGKNSRQAMIRSWENGHGVETDIRDHRGGLVVSHDIPAAPKLKLREMIDIFSKGPRRLILAINVKSDGLSELLCEALAGYPSDSYFTFDMSVPEMVRYIRVGLVVFTRHSDIEPAPVLLGESRGVWLDSFGDDAWLSPGLIRGYLDAGKRVCLVSPELHRRDESRLWGRLKGDPDLVAHPDFLLCTDKPAKAKEFFTP